MSRQDIYYWKCDRPAAFHGTHVRSNGDAALESQLHQALMDHFEAKHLTLRATASQGNHLTWVADVDGLTMFVRVENGPEKDDHLALESALLDAVRATGVKTPLVHGCDATRTQVPFAWQALELIASPDLNHWQKLGQLNSDKIAFDIGVAVAKWQSLCTNGYGPYSSQAWRESEQLKGYHACYEDYFCLRLQGHLDFLVSHGFFTTEQSQEAAEAVGTHCALLQLDGGCFVHKDLALWNILGTEADIAAFIDFDDSISGDPMDDLSLLACFHDAAFLSRAFAGYQSVKPLPDEYRRRFWLHLLRNMIVKAVIRVGAGYFDRTDGFFLIGSGSSGNDLRRITHERIALALRGLANNADINVV
jgi:fructosamine-3-kinase